MGVRIPWISRSHMVRSEMTDEAVDNRRRPGKKRKIIGLVLAVLVILFVFAGYGIFRLFIGGIEPGPTLIEELRSQAIKPQDVAQVHILKFDPGAGWPFTEDDYARKARCAVSPVAVIELMAILERDTRDGLKSRNHPESIYYGILRVDLVNGRRFYLFYAVCYYEGAHYASLRASSAGTLNPNGSRQYENASLPGFLSVHDPWYHDHNSPWPHPQSRVNSPDNVP